MNKSSLSHNVSTEMVSRLKFLPERQISARQMTRCEGRASEWLSWQTETTTLARSFLTRVREDHLKSDLDQRSRSDKWSRSFYPKDHLKRKDQDLDQDHPKRSLSCILKMETYTQFGRRLPPEMQASSGRKMTATDGRTGYSVISDITYFITYFVTLMSSEISFPNYVEKPSFH